MADMSSKPDADIKVFPLSATVGGPAAWKSNKEPDTSEIVRTIYGWISDINFKWSQAERIAGTLLPFDAEVSYKEEEMSWWGVWYMSEAIKSYWDLNHFVQSGRFKDKPASNVVYIPATYADLETLRGRADVTLPEEMTPEWFKTVFKSVAGLNSEPVDFSWAARYTKTRSLTVSFAKSPTLDRMLCQDPEEEDKEFSKYITKLIRERQWYPRWNFNLAKETANVETNESTTLRSQDETQDEKTLLPMPSSFRLVLDKVNWSRQFPDQTEGDNP
jgi:hypothetical protein